MPKRKRRSITDGTLDEGALMLERIRKLKRLTKRVARGLEEWEAEVLKFHPRQAGTTQGECRGATADQEAV